MWFCFLTGIIYYMIHQLCRTQRLFTFLQLVFRDIIILFINSPTIPPLPFILNVGWETISYCSLHCFLPLTTFSLLHLLSFCPFFLTSLLLLHPAMWSPWKQPLWSWVLTWGWWRCKLWRRERRPPGTAGPPPLLQTSTRCRWPQPRPGPGTAGLCRTPRPRCAGSLVGGYWLPSLLQHPFPDLQCHCQLPQVAQSPHWWIHGYVPLALLLSR